MRLLILSMPAVALVAVLSVSVQQSMINNAASDTQSALPEAKVIYRQYLLRHKNDAGKSFVPLAAKRPIVITPASGGSGSDW